ncbi:MAG: hypothetical protein V4665_02100 [Patescibacteria group bacterium]
MKKIKLTVPFTGTKNLDVARQANPVKFKDSGIGTANAQKTEAATQSGG